MALFAGILFIIVVIGILFIGVYNSLIQLRIDVREASADIDTLLKKRFDLIPNLVNTVKGYAAHEKSVFEKVTELRSKMGNAQSMEEKADVNNQMTQTLKTLFAVAENYPELKADASFIKLQTDLGDLETEIQKSRRFYNATVGEFNTKIQVFPNVLVAGMLGFTAEKFFQAADEEKENVTVQF